jgi:hypothetical protein
MTNELHMMRIVQVLTKQDVVPLHRALFYVMNCIATHKAMTCAEEQIYIIQRKTRQHIESETIDSH